MTTIDGNSRFLSVDAERRASDIVVDDVGARDPEFPHRTENVGVGCLDVGSFSMRSRG